MNSAPRPGRLLAVGVLMTVLWTAYAAGGAVLFFLAGRSAVIGMVYLLSALFLGYSVVQVWRRYAAAVRNRQT